MISGRQFNGPGNRPVVLADAVEQALSLQGPQMAHDAVGRADLKMLADFADRRAIAAGLHSFLDELKDGRLPGGELISERRHARLS